MIGSFTIPLPKRNKRLQTGWEGFFPYYAGFPELFAREVLASAKLSEGSVVLDPWNGSGTTTYSASRLGLRSVGVDLNPVMIIVARARLLAPSEADHLRPLAATILAHVRKEDSSLAPNDALLTWFEPEIAAFIRGIEESIRRSLLGNMTKAPDGIHLDRISGTAATLYVALFAACRKVVTRFQASNPTWLRTPKEESERILISSAHFAQLFAANVRGMSAALAAQRDSDLLLSSSLERGPATILLSDTTGIDLTPETVDFVLTSPPYCTRIDYTAATRIELAVLAPLLTTSTRALGRLMIGTTQVPGSEISVDPRWGRTCINFLESVRRHPSKASKGYYYKTHLDYFHKISESMSRISSCMKPGGIALFVVQDSYYKDLHNDLPKIFSEIGASFGLKTRRREDFRMSRSMSDINPGRKAYTRPIGATESVLCFVKDAGDA